MSRRKRSPYGFQRRQPPEIPGQAPAACAAGVASARCAKGRFGPRPGGTRAEPSATLEVRCRRAPRVRAARRIVGHAKDLARPRRQPVSVASARPPARRHERPGSGGLLRGHRRSASRLSLRAKQRRGPALQPLRTVLDARALDRQARLSPPLVHRAAPADLQAALRASSATTGRSVKRACSSRAGSRPRKARRRSAAPSASSKPG